MERMSPLQVEILELLAGQNLIRNSIQIAKTVDDDFLAAGRHLTIHQIIGIFLNRPDGNTFF